MQNQGRQNRQRRQMYYIDGSTVRKVDYSYSSAAPQRRRGYEQPERRRREYEQPQRRKRPVTYRKAAIKAEKSLAFDFKYTLFLAASLLIMAVACVNMLAIQGKVDKQQKNITALQNEIQTVNDDNSAYEDSLNNMYSLEEIYDIATNQLGMVYAKKGQIVYYDSANEDYVNQYQDVPEAN